MMNNNFYMTIYDMYSHLGLTKSEINKLIENELFSAESIDFSREEYNYEQ